jgi:hypothetical protein
MIKVGLGYIKDLPSREAGGLAARRALQSGEKPAITFLFTTEGYDQEEVLASVQAETGGAPLIGACGAGVVTPEGVLQNGVGVLTLSGAGLAVATARADFGRRTPEETGRLLGERLLSISDVASGTVFVFPDGLAGNIAPMLRGLYDALGPDFQYVGGGTGDNLRFFRTYQFTESGVSSGSVAAALVSGMAFGTGIGHGWQPMGSPLVITRADGKVVYELDERPAFDVYAERLGGIEPDRFPEYGVRFPLGIADASGRFIIRDPLEIYAGGALKMVTEMPAKAVVFLMEGELESLAGVGREVGRQALRGVQTPRFGLVFNCVSRFLLLGEKHDEAAVIQDGLGIPLSLLGLLTFGEVGAYNDVPLFHNKTLVVAVGGE